MSADWRSDILKFWFGLGYDDWWKADPALDHLIRQRFLKLWAEKRQLPVESFVGDPLTAVAAVILFDQFPRNMFRGHADQFATDHLALAIAKGAFANEFDKDLDRYERAFLSMPFQHSEYLADQDRAVLILSAIGEEHMLGYAKKHRDTIARYDRFPHRNAILGRAPRPGEPAGDEALNW